VRVDIELTSVPEPGALEPAPQVSTEPVSG
jgi:hypothetical protein